MDDKTKAAVHKVEELLQRFRSPVDYPSEATLYWGTVSMHRYAVLIFEDGTWGIPHLSTPGNVTTRSTLSHLANANLLSWEEVHTLETLEESERQQEAELSDTEEHLVYLQGMGYEITSPSDAT